LRISRKGPEVISFSSGLQIEPRPGKNRERRDLGKQAFNGKRLNGFHQAPEDLVLIGRDTDDGPEHPLYDPRVKLDADENLARDIMVNGVLQPIRVRKNGDAAEVVVGRQRVLAARLANEWLRAQAKEEVQVPFLVDKREDGDLLGVSISENEHRRPDDVIEKAKKAQRLLDLGKSPAEVAVRFGVTDRTIRNWTTLLQTTPKVKRAVAAGKLTATAATKLAGLDRSEQDEKLDELLTSGEKPTVSRTRDAAKGGEATPRGPAKKLVRQAWALGGDIPVTMRETLAWVLGEGEPPKQISKILAAGG